MTSASPARPTGTSARHRYSETLASNLPLHRGLTEEDGRALLAEDGFTQVASWQHLFGFNP